MRERGETMDIKISGLEKSFGKVQALKLLQIMMKQGEFTTLLGPSGCGKTTMTQNDCRTGREPDKGEIYFGDTCMYSSSKK
ncbi:ATP-binding cassette domain-containing protein [Bacillus paranthracis]